MTITNQECIGRALELLKDRLRPFAEREMKAQHAQRWFAEMKASAGDVQAALFGTEAAPRRDAGRAAERDVDPVEYLLCQDSGTRRTVAGQRIARHPQQMGASKSILG